MVTSRVAREEYNMMEVGMASKQELWQNELDVDAVGMNTKCYNCGGFGHIAANCRKGGAKGGKGGKGEYGGKGNAGGAGPKGGKPGGDGGKGFGKEGKGKGAKG